MEIDVQHTASDYRMMSAMCLEIAGEMSLDSDRLRLTETAEEWLKLAREREGQPLQIFNGRDEIALGIPAGISAITPAWEREAKERCESSDGEHAALTQQSVDSRTQTDVIGPPGEAIAAPLLELSKGQNAVSLRVSTETLTETDGTEQSLKMADAALAPVPCEDPSSQREQGTSAQRAIGTPPIAARGAWPRPVTVLVLAVLAVLLAALCARGLAFG